MFVHTSRVEEVCLNKEKAAGGMKSVLLTVISGCYDVCDVTKTILMLQSSAAFFHYYLNGTETGGLY